MRHFVVYHNAEKRGGDENPTWIESRKPLAKEAGGRRIWLIEGRGTSHERYFLTATFVGGPPRASGDDRPTYRVDSSGIPQVFRPPLALNETEGFPGFLKARANFSLGLQEITQSPYLNVLELLAKI